MIKTLVRNLIEDFVLLNAAFALRYGLSWRDSFNYLKQHGGLAFYQKHYGYEHTQSYDSTVDTLARICKQNGGKL
ncbi:hypothetical protein FACS189434_02520 [Bacteroidia bacterium]|jgi:hypothetical protein|nr:hypothetical protein FACS189434_02520 [Bacteroidia bacterium]